MFNDDEEDYFEGNLNEDIERFEGYLKGESMGFLDSDRVEILIDHFLINSQYTKAIKAADFANYQFPYNAVFLVRKAQAMSAMGKLKDALDVLNKAEQMDSNSCELVLTKGSIFSQLRDHKTAVKYFKEAIALSEPEDRDEIYLDLAMEYEALRDFKSALKILEFAIAENPNNEGAIYEIAFCYDSIGDFEKAIDCYSNFIDDNPYSFTAWYNLGNAYSKLEDYSKAVWAYDYCILINEEFGPVYFNLGNAFMGMEKFDEAIEAFEKCMELDGDDPVAMCYLGECYEQLGKIEEAELHYRKSLDLAPLLADAWLGLGIVEDLKGNTREGISLILKAQEIDPENAGIYHVLAGAFEKIDELEAAKENYQLSLSFDPSDQECLQDYIQLLSMESQVEALEFLNNYKTAVGDNDSISNLTVNLLWQLGRKQEALNLFKQCVEEDIDLAKEIFEINPGLLNVQEFVHLTGE